jgi:hypothetical protein
MARLPPHFDLGGQSAEDVTEFLDTLDLPEPTALQYQWPSFGAEFLINPQTQQRVLRSSLLFGKGRRDRVSEMVTESNIPVKGIVVETEALKALKFFAHNYTTLMFAGLGLGNKSWEGSPSSAVFAAANRRNGHLRSAHTLFPSF